MVFAKNYSILVSKLVMISLLSYLLYIAISCPCLPFAACHRRNVYTTLAACALLVFALNGPHFFNSTD